MTEPTKDPHPPRLLHVDDDRTCQQAVVEIASDYEVACVETIAGALLKLKQSRFQIAIIETQFVDGDAAELLAAIKATAPSTHVIVYSSNSFAGTQATSGSNEGLFVYAKKSEDHAELKRHLSRAAVSHPTANPNDSPGDSLGRMLLDAFPDLIIRIGRDGTYREFYNANQTHSFWRDSLPLGCHLTDILPHRLLVETLQAKESSLDFSAPFSIEYAIQANGSKRWLEARFSNVDEIDVIVMVRDVTQRKRAELLREGQNRVLRGLAMGSSLDDVLTDLAKTVEEVVDGAICSVLLLDESGEHLHHSACPSLPIEFVGAVDGVRIGPRVGSCGTAAFEKRRVIVEDTQSDPLWADYAGLAKQFELISCWSTPIIGTSGKVIGTFAIYRHHVHRPDDDELNLVDEIAHQAAIAIDHKQHALSLEISNERFRALVRNSPVAIIELDVNCRIIGINRTGVKSFAGRYVDHRQIVGSNWLDLVCDEDRPRIKDLVESAFDNHEANFEFVSHPDLGSRTFLTSFNPFRGEDGLIDKLLCIAADITDRIQHEQQLEEQLRFEKLISSVSADFIRLSIDKIDAGIDRTLAAVGKFLEVERGLVFLFSADMSALTCSHEWCDDGVESAQMRLRNVSSSDYPWIMEKYTSGEPIGIAKVEELPDAAHRERVELMAHGVQSLAAVGLCVGDRVLGVVCFDCLKQPRDWSTDVIARLRLVGEIVANAIARQRADEVLRISEQQYRNLFEGSIQGILIHRDCQPLLLNEAWAKMLGYRIDEIMAMESLLPLIAEVDREKLAQRYEARLRGEEVPQQYEFRCLHKSGRQLWIEHNVKVIDWEAKPAIQLTAIDVTERRAAEEKLRQSEEQLRDVLQSVPAFIMTIGLDGSMLYLNKTQRGLKMSDVLGRSIYDFIHADDHAIVQDALSKVTQQRRSVAVEHRAHGGGNTIAWYATRFGPIEKDGRLFAISAMSTEITELKQAEEHLRKSEQRFRDLFNNSPDAIFVEDFEGRVLDANRSACELHGFERAELLGKSVLDLVPPETRVDVNREFSKLVSGEIRQLEGFSRTIDGRDIPIELKVSLIEYDASPALLLHVRDISERKKVEDALRMSEERFRQMAENIYEVFWLVDWNERQVLYVSPAYEEIWGHPPQAVYDDMMCWLDYVHPEDRDRIGDAFLNYPGIEPMELNFRIVHPSGEVRYLHDRMFPITKNDGESYRVAGVMADVTDRILMESELRKREAELAHVSRLTTIGELAAELAHEINQPLYAISNYASACQNAASGGVADDTRNLLNWTQQIAEQANRAGGIIRRMNRFLRKSEPELKATDLNQLIRETLDLIDVERRTYEIRVDLDLASQLPSVLVDPVLMQQVLVNLTRNAIDAMDGVDDRDRLMTIRSRLNGSEMIEIEISDVGRGMNEETKRQLFNPFFTTKENGLGMGLTICRSAVESHHGKIWVTENADHGSTFHIRLPIDAELVRTPSLHSSTESPATP